MTWIGQPNVKAIAIGTDELSAIRMECRALGDIGLARDSAKKLTSYCIVQPCGILTSVIITGRHDECRAIGAECDAVDIGRDLGDIPARDDTQYRQGFMHLGRF
jgi:hypothetical protein